VPRFPPELPNSRLGRELAEPPRDALNERPSGGRAEKECNTECVLDVPPERGRDDEPPTMRGLEDEVE